MLNKAEIKKKNNDVELKLHRETAWKHNSTQKQVEYYQKRIDVIIFDFEAKWRRVFWSFENRPQIVTIN